MSKIKLVMHKQPQTRNYYRIDLTCKKLPCPFATADGICTANQCIKAQFATEELFWQHMEGVYRQASDIINQITEETGSTP